MLGLALAREVAREIGRADEPAVAVPVGFVRLGFFGLDSIADPEGAFSLSDEINMSLLARFAARGGARAGLAGLLEGWSCGMGGSGRLLLAAILAEVVVPTGGAAAAVGACLVCVAPTCLASNSPILAWRRDNGMRLTRRSIRDRRSWA